MKEKKLMRPRIPKYAKGNAHIYYLLVKKNLRNKLIKYLKSNNIISHFHYIPLHSSYYFRKYYKKKNNLPNTDLISSSLIRLPMHNKIKKTDIKKIYKIIKNFLKIK